MNRRVAPEVRPALDRWLLVMVDRTMVRMDARHPAMRYPLTRVVGCYETREAAEAAAKGIENAEFHDHGRPA